MSEDSARGHSMSLATSLGTLQAELIVTTSIAERIVPLVGDCKVFGKPQGSPLGGGPVRPANVSTGPASVFGCCDL